MFLFFLRVKDYRGVVCFRGRGRVIAAAVIHKGIRCGSEGEDRFNGRKKMRFNESIGVIYSYGQFAAHAPPLLQHVQYLIMFCSSGSISLVSSLIYTLHVECILELPADKHTK